ncbi:MAG: hypothetical protein J7K21_00650 [Desulfurococcales archaeon]|nr:hypothetical protein [Desulfurococcales archaeon]
MGEEVVFEGVIVGFEQVEGFEASSIYIQGSINNEQKAFYLLIDTNTYKKILRLGIGQAISGKGVVVSSNDTLVIKAEHVSLKQ